ncbi:MAG: STN domain-containing protein, partial [Prevotella sp.]|nr:STN domain-containing protein [Prevotella sp.]
MQKSKSRMLSVLLSIVLMCVAFPSHVQAQNNQTGKKDLVTLDMKSATVTQVFRQIKEQTGYHFVINSDLASSLPKVNVQVKNKSVPEVLDIVLANLDCAYEINGNMITVYKKSVPRTV